MQADTIPKLFLEDKKKWGSEVAMRQKDRGLWKEYAWNDVYNYVKYLSLGLRNLGLNKGDKAVIIGDNTPEWTWAYLATMAAGGITVGIFVDAIHDEIKYVVNHSDAKFAIVQDQEQVDKFLDLEKEIPKTEKVIFWDAKGLVHYNNPILMDITEVMKIGRSYEKKHAGAFEDFISRGKKEDVASFYYTSGTSGLPKAGMITHEAMLFSSRAYLSKTNLNQKHNLLSSMPAAWIGDSLFSTIPHLIGGAKLNFPEEPETIQEDLREIGPHVVINGPKQWEGLVAQTEFKISDGGRLQRFVYRFLFPIGLKRAELKVQKERPGVLWKLLFYVGDVIVFRPLLDKLGLRRVKIAITGSAAMSDETFQFWRAVGLELRQMYASTEAGFICGHDRDDIRDDTIGTSAPGVKVDISSEGEIIVKSPGLFSGYFKNQEKTEEVLKNGWFHTGDAGLFHENGHLVFIDRLDDLKELATGHKYSPQYIEGLFRTSPYIRECVVVGGKENDYIIVLVDIRFDNVGSWAESKHISYTTLADLSQRDEVGELIKKDAKRVNRRLEKALKIKKFIIFNKELDPDEAEITRTRKLRRGLMEKRYAELIYAIYSGAGEFNIESVVTYQDGRTSRMIMPIKVREV
jgi:long-chain acyl-CoA synthetase